MAQTILIAAQKDDWRDLLIHVIERCGYEVIAVSKPDEVTAAATGADLILLDLALVRDRAEAIIKELQNSPATNHIAVLCQATYGTEWAAPRLIKAGAKEVLYKPFDLSKLPSILRDYVSTAASNPLPCNSGLPAIRSGTVQLAKSFKSV